MRRKAASRQRLRVQIGGRLATAWLSCAAPALAQTEKAAEDPTKIATKAGVSYSDEASVSGSLAFGSPSAPNDTLGASASYIDNSFGQKQKLSVSYRHEF